MKKIPTLFERDPNGIRAWMAATKWEGLVWHHPEPTSERHRRTDG